MKIHQHGAKIFNKSWTFKVNIWFVAPHSNHLIKRIPVIEVSCKNLSRHGAKIFNKTCSFALSISADTPHFNLSHQKNACYRSLVKICQHGAKIFNKT